MNTSLDKKIAFALGSVLMVYLILRAYFIPLVHDEAATFFHYVHNGRFLPSEKDFDANNHFLNSFLTYYFYHLFGSGELSLRLASLIFFPVFCIYWFNLSGLMSDRFIRWIFLLSGFLAHNYIEFFALSRGYGMSMALLAGSLWYFISAFKKSRKFFLLPGVLFLLLALYANLSLLNTVILLMCILTGYFFIHYRRPSFSNSSYWYFPEAYNEKIRNTRWIQLMLLFVAAGITLAALRLFAMKEHGNLYYGSGEGFWIVTVRSVKKMLMDTHHRIPSFFIAAMIACFSSGLIFLFIKSKEKMKLFFNPEFIFPFLLFGNVLSAVLLNKLFKVNFAEDRVGLYLYPFFVGSVCFTADAVIKKLSWTSIRLVALPLLFFPVHFMMHINLSHSSLWCYENIPHRFYDKVAEYIKPGEAPPTMGGYRMREVTWAYQNFRHGGKAGMISYTNFPEHQSDYQVAIAASLGNWPKYYNRIDYDKCSDLSLLKRKHFLNKQFICTDIAISTKYNTKREFFDLLPSINIDTLAWQSIYVSAEFTLQSWHKPFAAWLVVEVKDKGNNMLRYERIPFDWLKTSWDKNGGKFINGIELVNLPANTHKLTCYIWNIDRTPFRISDGACSVYKIIK